MKGRIVMAVGALVMATSIGAFAQNGPTCSTRCETQYDTCHAGAEAALELCLDRAIGAHEKAACAVAFVKLEDACRTTESSCLSNCPTP